MFGFTPNNPVNDWTSYLPERGIAMIQAPSNNTVQIMVWVKDGKPAVKQVLGPSGQVAIVVYDNPGEAIDAAKSTGETYQNAGYIPATSITVDPSILAEFERLSDASPLPAPPAPSPPPADPIPPVIVSAPVDPPADPDPGSAPKDPPKNPVTPPDSGGTPETTQASPKLPALGVALFGFLVWLAYSLTRR